MYVEYDHQREKYNLYTLSWPHELLFSRLSEEQVTMRLDASQESAAALMEAARASSPRTE